jgi:hypothetical protein
MEQAQFGYEWGGEFIFNWPMSINAMFLVHLLASQLHLLYFILNSNAKKYNKGLLWIVIKIKIGYLIK